MIFNVYSLEVLCLQFWILNGFKSLDKTVEPNKWILNDFRSLDKTVEPNKWEPPLQDLLGSSV